MSIKQTLTSILVSVSASFASCAYHATHDRPQVQTKALDDYLSNTAHIGIQATPESHWWQQFQSPELNQLIDELKQNNLDLASARQRISKTKALLGMQRADDWPALNVQASARNSRRINGDAEASESSNLNFSAAYEVDIWGARSAARYSAKLSVLAQQQEYRSLLLQLQAALAQNYFEHLALQNRYAIAVQNLNASQALLDLILLRFNAGGASGIEVSQQRNTWLAARALVLGIERAKETSQRALAVLLGREDLGFPRLEMPFSSIQEPKIKLVQPAALLEYRPDIKLAETQLYLNESALYQQRKKRWPQLNLSAGLSLDEVFANGDEWTSSFLGALTMPLFNAGKIKQQIVASEADHALSQINYRQVVLQAMQETLDTLSELEYQKNLLRVREQELENNEQLYKLATLRYESGDTDFINLLAAQRSWFNARDSVIQARRFTLFAAVNVFKAMGASPNTKTALDILGGAD